MNTYIVITASGTVFHIDARCIGDATYDATHDEQVTERVVAVIDAGVVGKLNTDALAASI